MRHTSPSPLYRQAPYSSVPNNLSALWSTSNNDKKPPPLNSRLAVEQQQQLGRVCTSWDARWRPEHRKPVNLKKHSHKSNLQIRHLRLDDAMSASYIHLNGTEKNKSDAMENDSNNNYKKCSASSATESNGNNATPRTKKKQDAKDSGCVRSATFAQKKGASCANVTNSGPYSGTESALLALIDGYSSCFVTKCKEADGVQNEISRRTKDKNSDDLADNYQLEARKKVIDDSIRHIQEKISRLRQLNAQHMQLAARLNEMWRNDNRGGTQSIGRSAGKDGTPTSALHFHLGRKLEDIKAETESMMGRIQIDIKGIVGFARIAPGDVFDVQVKCSGQKLRSRGKTQQDRTQKWDRATFIFNCNSDANIVVKTSEVKFFGKLKLLDEQSFEVSEFFTALPQQVTMSLNATGSLKLQLVVSWIPELSWPGSAARGSDCGLLNGSGGTMGRSLHNMTPTGDNNKTRSISVSTGLNKQEKRANRARRCTSALYLLKTDKSLSSSRPDEFDEIQSVMNNEISACIGLLVHKYPVEIGSLSNTIVELDRMIKLPGAWAEKEGTSSKLSSRQVKTPEATRSRALDSNEAGSENDSGIDSLRHGSPGTSSKATGNTNNTGGGAAARKLSSRVDKQRRKSIGAVLELNTGSFATGLNTANLIRKADILACMKVHLLKTSETLQTLCSMGHTASPLVHREHQFRCRLNREISTLEDLAHLAKCLIISSSAITIHQVLSDLRTPNDIQATWLRCAMMQGDYTLCVKETLLRIQLRHFLEPIVSARYPSLVDNVTDALLVLITECSSSSPMITVFQFVSAFRGRHVVSYVESLAHEAWIAVQLSSCSPPAVEAVMHRLRLVPVAPPLESMRHIGLTLNCATDPNIVGPIVRYLSEATGTLREDLINGFISLLENEDVESRKGACKAVATIKCFRSMQALKHVASADRSAEVRAEAQDALHQINEIVI